MGLKATSVQGDSDSATDFAALQFVITSFISRISTAMPVRVVSCTNAGGLSAFGFVNVQPLLTQLSGGLEAVPHGALFQIPYLRVQGGANAVIMDPEPGDIGIAVFASRDISALKGDEGVAQARGERNRGLPPASNRQYNMSDGMYLGGILNAQPEQYVRFSGEGVEVVSPTKIRLSAPEIEINAGTSVTVTAPSVGVEASSDVTIDSPANDISGGNTQIDGKIFLQHTHSGVQTGGGTSGPVA
jgi:hypothetical protein